MANYYLVMFVIGAAQPFVFDPESSAWFLMQLSAAMPPTYWLLFDAKRRGIFIPHIVQPGIISLWWILVPGYLIHTRGWRGLGFSLAHFFGAILVLCAGFYLSVVIYWGPALLQ